MAENTKNTQAADTLPAEEKKNSQTAGTAAMPAKKRQQPAQYTVHELAAASEKVLGLPPECTAAALKISGKERMTVDEAGTAVQKFMAQEVK